MTNNKFEKPNVERAVLSSLIKNPDLLIELDGKLSKADFSFALHQDLFELILGLYNQGYVSFTSDELKNFLHKITAVDPKTASDYIDVLFDINISNANFENYVTDIIDSALKRKLLENLDLSRDEIIKSLDTYPGTLLLNSVQESLMKLSDSHHGAAGPKDISIDIKKDILDRLNKGTDNLGVPSGIGVLDKHTMGWKKKRLYVVSARPKQGKSSLLLGFTMHAAYFAKYNRVPVLHLDTEMDWDEWSTRATAHLSGVNNQIIEAGSWGEDEKATESVDRALEKMSQPGWVYFEHIPDFSIDRLTSVIRKYVYTKNVGLVVFDYIKLPESADLKNIQYFLHYTLLAKRLKYLAKTLDVPIISALQQNREGEGKSRVDGRALSGGDGPLQEADGIFALNWKGSKEIQTDGMDAGTHLMQVEYLRNGPPNFNGINLYFKGYCNRFLEAKDQVRKSGLVMDRETPEPNAKISLQTLNNPLRADEQFTYKQNQ